MALLSEFLKKQGMGENSLYLKTKDADPKTTDLKSIEYKGYTVKETPEKTYIYKGVSFGNRFEFWKETKTFQEAIDLIDKTGPAKDTKDAEFKKGDTVKTAGGKTGKIIKEPGSGDNRRFTVELENGTLKYLEARDMTKDEPNIKQVQEAGLWRQERAKEAAQKFSYGTEVKLKYNSEKWGKGKVVSVKGLNGVVVQFEKNPTPVTVPLTNLVLAKDADPVNQRAMELAESSGSPDMPIKCGACGVKIKNMKFFAEHVKKFHMTGDEILMPIWEKEGFKIYEDRGKFPLYYKGRELGEYNSKAEAIEASKKTNPFAKDSVESVLKNMIGDHDFEKGDKVRFKKQELNTAHGLGEIVSASPLARTVSVKFEKKSAPIEAHINTLAHDTQDASFECMECGRKFKKSGGLYDVKCPKCGGYDVELTGDAIEMRKGPDNYYDLIVAAAREENDPKLTKEKAKSRLERCFKNLSVIFDPSKFDQAFREFAKAGANRMAYGTT